MKFCMFHPGCKLANSAVLCLCCPCFVFFSNQKSGNSATTKERKQTEETGLNLLRASEQQHTAASDFRAKLAARGRFCRQAIVAVPHYYRFCSNPLRSFFLCRATRICGRSRRRFAHNQGLPQSVDCSPFERDCVLSPEQVDWDEQTG